MRSFLLFYLPPGTDLNQGDTDWRLHGASIHLISHCPDLNLNTFCQYVMPDSVEIPIHDLSGSQDYSFQSFPTFTDDARRWNSRKPLLQQQDKTVGSISWQGFSSETSGRKDSPWDPMAGRLVPEIYSQFRRPDNSSIINHPDTDRDPALVPIGSWRFFWPDYHCGCTDFHNHWSDLRWRRSCRLLLGFQRKESRIWILGRTIEGWDRICQTSETIQQRNRGDLPSRWQDDMGLWLDRSVVRWGQSGIRINADSATCSSSSLPEDAGNQTWGQFFFFPSLFSIYRNFLLFFLWYHSSHASFLT